MGPVVPPGLLPVFEACAAAGGRALLVGGCVRDALCNRPSKDLDLEVHGLELSTLARLLRRFGAVNEVGRSFGVLKLRWDGQEIDVAVPRRDEKGGPGHKGIVARPDSSLDLREAARRRDLTINAIAYDPLTDTWIDPFDGRADLAAGRLRAVDATTFGEDPLRALRVAQFAARFDFTVTPELEALCARMPLTELPAERVRMEVEKLFLKGVAPAVGWDFAWRAGLWRQVLPAWDHACPPGLPRVCRLELPDGPKLALAYAAAGAVVVTLDRLRVFRREGYPLRERALFLAAHPDVGTPTDEAVRRLAEEGDVALLALHLDRPDLAEQARRLGVSEGPLPALLGGKDLAALGVQPGPQMGELLAELRSAQLAGTVVTPADARAWMNARIGE